MNIYFGSGENYQLSNLSHRPFTDNKGTMYQSVEHAYQTWKSGSFDPVYYKPWKHGSKYVGKKRADFATNKNLMYRLIKRSFEQNPEALQVLKNTGDEVLTHNQDRGVWKELFPSILMRVRKEL